MNRAASHVDVRMVQRRYRQDPISYYDGLRQFGIRDASVWSWVTTMLSDPDRYEYYWEEDGRSDLVRMGWRSSEYWEFLDRWEPPEHYWIPPSRAYVAFGYFDQADSFSGRTMTEAVPGWRISAKVTRSRFVVQGVVDAYDGERIEEIGSMPLPHCGTRAVRRPVCRTCFLELPLSGRCTMCS